MAVFTGSIADFSPSLTNDNWTIDAHGAPIVGKVISFSWGGAAVTSLGYRTRWTRPIAPAPTGNGVPIIIGHPDGSTQLMGLYSTYATTQPTLSAEGDGELHHQNWNAQGGGGYIILPEDARWTIVSGGIPYSFVSCRNAAGLDVGLTDYGVTYREGD